MKKGKVIRKGQIAVAAMVLCLGAAIWLNAKYLPSSTKYLGEASYVNGTAEENTVQTSAKAEASDYFTTAQKSRQKAYEKAAEKIEELLDTDSLSKEEKTEVSEAIKNYANNIKAETDIESLLTAKGFEKALAVIGDNAITVVVKSEGLTSAQTLQIQDIVTSNTNIPLQKIKIVPIAK